MIEIPFNKKYTHYQGRNVLLFAGIATPKTEKNLIFFKKHSPAGTVLHPFLQYIRLTGSEQCQISGTASSQ